MKKGFLLIFITLLPALLIAQVSSTRTAGTGWYLQTAHGDTLHLSGATPFYNRYDQAHVDAANYSADNGGIVVHVRANIDDRVQAHFFNDEIIIEEVVDTFYVAADTIYISGETYHIEHTEMLSNINDGIDHNSDSEVYTHRISGKAFADHLSFEWICSGQTVGEYSESHWSGDFYTSIPLDCQENLTYKVTAESQLEPTRKKTAIHEEDVKIETILNIEDPDMGTLYHTDFSDFDPDEWQQTWGQLDYEVIEIDSTSRALQITLPQRSIARLQWDRVPEHTNAEYLVIEEIHESHSTGAHIGLRTSQGLPRNAVETYINNAGLGISTFLNGSWGNPANYDFDWSYGDRVVTNMVARGDSVMVQAYQDGESFGVKHTYKSDVIGDMPPGFFAIGSTGAGTYIIHEIAVVVYD